MTFDKVMKVFAKYLHEDADCEVVQTRRGYTLLQWDDRAEDWVICELCPTPEELCESLASTYENYMEYKLTAGKRELTRAEQEQIATQRERLEELCGK